MVKTSSNWRPLIAVFALIFLIPFGIAMFGRTQSGEGTRSGVVVKLSYKGRINKSWEGELMLGGVHSGTTWDFSLDPSNPQTPSLAKALQAAELSATPVTLKYQQHFIGPWSTDTNYLVIEQLSE
jgi:hypothetical protein